MSVLALAQLAGSAGGHAMMVGLRKQSGRQRWVIVSEPNVVCEDDGGHGHWHRPRDNFRLGGGY